MSRTGPRRILRKARTAATLPARIVSCEDRCSALETHVQAKLDEMRADLAEIRSLLRTQIEGDSEATALLGRLLQATASRLEAVESELAGHDPEPHTSESSAS